MTTEQLNEQIKRLQSDLAEAKKAAANASKRDFFENMDVTIIKSTWRPEDSNFSGELYELVLVGKDTTTGKVKHIPMGSKGKHVLFGRAKMISLVKGITNNAETIKATLGM